MDISKLRGMTPDELYKRMDGWNPGDAEFEQAKLELERQFSEGQTKAAQTMERYTITLVRLTWGLVWLTVALLVFAIGVEILHQCSKP